MSRPRARRQPFATLNDSGYSGVFSPLILTTFVIAIPFFAYVTYILHHCRPVKQAVSADKGMILNAVLAI
jgi:hypothetical protein